MLCLEHGLSIIEKPGLSKGHNRAEYLGGDKTPSVRDRLRDLIDASISAGMSFDGFIEKVKAAGCEVKRGKHLAFKIPDGKRFIRCDSPGENYTENALLERISGSRVTAPKQKGATSITSTTKPSLLIDIQAKMQQGKGEGYRHCATTFNLKEMSKTLIFLSENGIEDYDDLVEKSAAASGEYNDRLAKIKAVEERLGEISELQKHIGTYGKTREVYAQYKASGWDKNFYEQFRADITLHKAARKYFDEHGYGKNKKLPSM